MGVGSTATREPIFFNYHSPVVAEHLHKKGIACVEQKTPQALETYEKLLSKGEKAVAFLHLGC